MPGPTGNAVVEAMGATPVTMPVPDLPQALATSAVDGALIPWEIIPALNLQDVTQYQIEGPDKSRFGTTTFQVSMNKARWEAMPDDIKQAFDKASDEDWLRKVAEVWRASDDHGIQIAIDAGNEHITLTAGGDGDLRRRAGAGGRPLGRRAHRLRRRGAGRGGRARASPTYGS